MKIVMAESGEELSPGSMVHVAHGPSLNQAWRLEGVAPRKDGDHHVRVSHNQPRIGRVTKTFHPSVFGLAIVVDVRLYADTAKMMRALRTLAAQTVLLTVGGVVAWFVAEYMSHRYGG